MTMQELHYTASGSLFADWTPYVTDYTSGRQFTLVLCDVVSCPEDSDLTWRQVQLAGKRGIYYCKRNRRYGSHFIKVLSVSVRSTPVDSS